MPKSFRLYDKSECAQFFDYINSERYKDHFTKEGL